MNPDVLIVGGGPAGASAALRLARLLPSLRDRVLVIDKKRFPREKPCGGGLSGRALDALAEMGVAITVPSVATDVAQYRFGSRLSRFRVPGACRVVRRAEFDAMLLAAARSRGVEVALDEALVALERREDGILAVTTRRSIPVRAVIGADGAGSLVRRLAGLPPPRSFARLHLLEIPAREDATPEFVDGAFTFDYTPVPSGLEGYVWDFPSRIAGAPYLNTGIYHRNARGAGPGREWLLALLRARARRHGADPAATRLRSYPDVEYEPGVPLAAPGVLLAGSAAGINGLTGEGIWQSLVYGRLAAEAVAAALGSGDFTFAGYTRAVAESPMGRDLNLSRRVADLFYGRHFWTLYSFQERNEDLRRAFIESFAGRFDLARLPKTSLAARWWWHLAWGRARTPRPDLGPWRDALLGTAGAAT